MKSGWAKDESSSLAFVRSTGRSHWQLTPFSSTLLVTTRGSSERLKNQDVTEKQYNLKAAESISWVVAHNIRVRPRVNHVLEVPGGLRNYYFVVLASMSWALATQKDEHRGRPVTATLTGAAGVPGPGDADGTGTAKITLNAGQGQVCYELTVSNIGAATAAHIHTGAATVAGPVLVGLQAPGSGSSKGCVDLDKEKVKEIIQNPANYYVNLHNAEFPDGAVRGQLSM